MEIESKDRSLFVKLIVGVVLLWAISAVLIIFFMNGWSERGTFGDLFGAVNALFSGLAFAALLYTIVLQREEIKQNRNEIVLNRKELAKGSKLQQKSQQVLVEQVAQTHLTAKMNAMRIVVDYYNSLILSPKSSEETIEKAKEKRKQIIRKIDVLIEDLSDSEAE